jgi:6-phosphofructokinase 2
MIYTFTLNPALDRTIWIEDFSPGEAIRIQREERFPGGKGIDVSRMIKTLGGNSIALGFLGGYTGLEIEGRLFNEGIPHNFIRISGETRTNLIIHATKTSEELKINAPGPAITPSELGQLLDQIRNLKPSPTYAVISGSIPQGLTTNIYAQLILTLESLGAKVIFDSDGEPFAKGIVSTPYMIKPNRRELETLVGRKLPRVEDIVTASKEIINDEIRVVAVSAGKDGLYVITREGGFHCTTPDVKVIDSNGAGDSTVAGIVWGLESGYTLAEAARLGVACGTATAMFDGPAVGDLQTIQTLLPQIGIEPLSV